MKHLDEANKVLTGLLGGSPFGVTIARAIQTEVEAEREAGAEVAAQYHDRTAANAIAELIRARK